MDFAVYGKEVWCQDGRTQVIAVGTVGTLIDVLTKHGPDTIVDAEAGFICGEKAEEDSVVGE